MANEILCQRNIRSYNGFTLYPTKGQVIKYECSLYNCKSEKKLSQYLLINDFNYYKKLRDDLKVNPMPYYRYKNDIAVSGREFFQCLEKIAHIHTRLRKLFGNLPKEAYLKSGIKKQSYITNAQSHAQSNHFFLIDIKSFFPSITKDYIKQELILTYKQSSNVAEFVANAITARQVKSENKRALVTGSPLSQYFAYVINKRMFDELYELAKLENITFSVYVDDISFSANRPIEHEFLRKVFYIIKSNGYKISKNTADKKKFYRGKIGINSTVTGILVKKNGLFIPKVRQDKIENNLILLADMKLANEEFESLYNSTKSSIYQAIAVNQCYKIYLSQIEEIKNLPNKMPL